MTNPINDDDWCTWEGLARIQNKCRDQAKSEGLTGLDLYFRANHIFTEALNSRPTYKERHAAWYKEQIKNNPPVTSPIADILREALQAIADGHNDPRALAQRVLGETIND